MRSSLKLVAAGLAFVLSYAFSFPIVIPGGTEPMLLHKLLGRFLILLVIPLFFYVVEHAGPTLKRQIAAIYAITLPANAMVFYWCYFALNTYGEIDTVLTVLILLLMYSALSTFWVVFFLICRFLSRRGRVAPWLVAVTWTVNESVRGLFPVDFFWSVLGHSQYNNPVTLQWASIGSVYLISFMIVWLSAYVYTLIKKEHPVREGIVLTIVLAVLCIYSAVQLHIFRNEKPEKEVKVAIMQPAINQFDINQREVNVFNIIGSLTSQLNTFDDDSELVVWHEAAMPFRIPVGFTDFQYIMDKYFPDAKNFRNHIVGMDMVNNEFQSEYYNAAGFIQDGEIKKIYRKIKLAPFGEYLPWSEFLRSIGFRTLIPEMVGDFGRGKEHTVYDFGGFKASILICYDGTSAESVAEFVRNGAELLVNISNDAWFGASSETFQHGSFYRFRAVESGRTIIRAANVGISEVVLPNGEVEDSTEFFKAATINRKVPLYTGKTIYRMFGNWFLYSLIAVLCYFLLKALKREK